MTGSGQASALLYTAALSICACLQAKRPQWCLHKWTSGVIRKPRTNTARPTSATRGGNEDQGVTEGRRERETGMKAERTSAALRSDLRSSYIFIQVGLLQVYHFELDPLQNLFQRLTCFVVQLFT